MREADAKTLLFAGPTLSRAQKIDPDLSLAGITLLPPVTRGDLFAMDLHPTGVCVLVDGLFHQSLAVGHAEVRRLLRAGWQVWGLSSMGAIRAREMCHLGVRGFGRVFERFCQTGVDFRDDEVALLHDSAPSYRELSEPLCHLRRAVEVLVMEGRLAPMHGARIIEDLAERWFGDRTLARFLELLSAYSGDGKIDPAAILSRFDEFRLKAWDLLDFLRSRPDLKQRLAGCSNLQETTQRGGNATDK